MQRAARVLHVLFVRVALVLAASEWECPAGSISGSHGIAACCPASCGHCGGRGCEEREGGRQACCALDIQTAGRSCNGTAPPCVPLERSGDRHSILAKRTEACRSAAVRVRQPLPAPTKPAAFIVVTLGNRDEDNPRGARLRQFFHAWNVTCAGYPDPPVFEECRSTLHPLRGVGVTRAFVRCADAALARGHESVFFFEDDAVPYDAELCDPAARRGLSDSAPRDARVVLLGGHQFVEPRKRAWYRPGAAVELHTPLHHGPDAHVFRALDFSYGAYA